MYERFTDNARKVMQFANMESQMLNHEYIGTEHMLLGFLNLSLGICADLGLDLESVRRVCEILQQPKRAEQFLGLVTAVQSELFGGTTLV